MPTTAETIRANIRRKREAAGLTRLQLANEMGVDPQTVYRWETETEWTQLGMLDRMAAALGTTAKQLQSQ